MDTRYLAMVFGAGSIGYSKVNKLIMNSLRRPERIIFMNAVEFPFFQVKLKVLFLKVANPV
jgi:hypothetical protein